MDQTPWAAEFWAAILVLRAAARAGVDLVILIDNLSVCTALQQIAAGVTSLPRYGYGWWLDAIDALTGRSHDICWVPSHDKNKEWRPKLHGQTADGKLWRQLNSEADAPASQSGKDKANRLHRSTILERGDGRVWATEVLRTLHRAATDYDELQLQRVEDVKNPRAAPPQRRRPAYYRLEQ